MSLEDFYASLAQFSAAESGEDWFEGDVIISYNTRARDSAKLFVVRQLRWPLADSPAPE